MPPPIPLHLPRPASLVIRFTSSERFNRAIELYTKFLGAKPVESEPEKFASFQVGAAPVPDARDMEFRLELHPGDTSNIKGHTLLYWAIDPRKEGEIKELAKKFAYSNEVKGTEPLAARQFLLTDGFDNFFGGHTNPPFPPGTPPLGPGGPQGFLHRPGFLAGLLSGVVLGGLLVGVARARRG